jgi:hypothetical protein
MSRSGRTSIFKTNPISLWEPGGKEGVGGKDGLPSVSPHTRGKEGVGTGGERGGTKLLHEVTPMKGVTLPSFHPVEYGLFLTEYEKMIAEERRQIKKVQENFREKVPTKNALSYLAWVQENEHDLDLRAKKIKAAEADRTNYTTQLTAEGNAHVKCRLARIEEIGCVMRGEKKQK